jgi:hypothetical protein
MLLFACLATMLPLRPGFKHMARELMQSRRTTARTDTVGTVLIADAAIPANAWETEDEFRLNGGLYDVVDVTYKAGIKHYRCLSDELEVSAEKDADKLVADMVVPHPRTPQGRIAKSLADWLSHLFYEAPVWQSTSIASSGDRLFASAPIPPLPKTSVASAGQPPEA